jgi:hypothetical protein
MRLPVNKQAIKTAASTALNITTAGNYSYSQHPTQKQDLLQELQPPLCTCKTQQPGHPLAVILGLLQGIPPPHCYSLLQLQ